jgi:hypothetical protein
LPIWDTPVQTIMEAVLILSLIYSPVTLTYNKKHLI